MDCKKAQNLLIHYINNELKDEELEEFLDHIENCKECYEELEIHFTVQYALQKLDEDDKVSFDIPKMLKENLKNSKTRVIRRKILRYASTCMMVVAEFLLLLTVMMQLEMFSGMRIENTIIYQMLNGQTEVTESERMEPESQSEGMESEPGQNSLRV